MTDRETTLIERWRRERPAYEAWGAFVSETLSAAVAAEIHPVEVELFFRIPITSRTKSESSLLAKAFHRGKSYSEPFDEIEDKVGVRIVVLVTEEIRVVERAIKSCSKWVCNMARDFEEERAQRPIVFDYQSLHYIVRTAEKFNHNGVDIAVNTACEIQVRTILQHAYSELTHDTIYKPSVQAKPDVKRAAAKSMALIEATDDYFMQVRERLALAQAPGGRVAMIVDKFYQALTGVKPDISPLNDLIIDHFKKWAKEDFELSITNFVDDKKFLADVIRSRVGSGLLYRQSGILLVYWAISQAPREISYDSPLSDDELAPLYSDLGERLPDNRA